MDYAEESVLPDINDEEVKMCVHTHAKGTIKMLLHFRLEKCAYLISLFLLSTRRMFSILHTMEGKEQH